MPCFLVLADLSLEPSVEDICYIKQNIMNTFKINSSNAADLSSFLKSNKTWQKYIAFADSQTKNRMLWFLVAFVFQAVVFLPIPAALMYYYNASVVTLAITVLLFFGFLVVGMTGFGIRTLIFYSAFSFAVNLTMLAIYIL